MGKDQDLLAAVRTHDKDSLQRLLCKSKSGSKSKLIGTTKKINVNYQDGDGMTALHQAALMGDVEVMKLLIDTGALVDIRDTKGMRPLHYASWQGKEIRAVTMLLTASSSANDPAHDGMTPLHLACEHGHFNVVTQLLQHHGDPTAENEAHKTPLDLACEFGRITVVELLIQSNLCDQLLLGNPQEDMADNTRSTCLHLAAKNGHHDIIRLLLQAGVDINRQTLKGTCLHEAALCGKIEVVRLLLDAGVDVNKTNSYDQTALDIVNKFTGTRAAKELKKLLKEASYVVHGRAIKDYSPAMHDPNHITLKEGDILTVLEQHPSGMWKGYVSRADGHVTKTGYFPASAVVLVDSQAVRGQHLLGSGNLGQVMPQITPNHVPTSHSQVPDLISRQTLPRTATPPGAGAGDKPFGTVGADESFPPPPSPLVSPKHYSSRDSDRDSGISPQQSYPSQSFSQSSLPVRQPSPNSPAERTAEWLGRYVVDGDHRSASPNRDSPGSSNRNSTASNSSGGYMSHGYVTTNGQSPVTQQHRLSGQSYESGVSGVSATSRTSYHSNSSSSLGSLDRLEESGYSSTVNVHELFQSGLADKEILRAWLAELHFEEYYELFFNTGYDMATIAHMTPQDLSAVGISNPKHRKRLKSEINKLQFHDGFPEHIPADIGEWLHLLGLEEYHTCLSRECESMEGIVDIECEDLEEIGITKLGHQKKIQVAIERLKRIQSGKRLSSVDRKTSESGDSPGYASGTKWLGVDPPSYWGRGIRKSSSGDNLYGQANGPLELTTFQQPKEETGHRVENQNDVMGQSWPTHHNAGPSAAQDIITIQPHRAVSMHQRSGSEGRIIEGDPPPQYTFYDRRDEVVDGDATPTNERRRIPSTDDTDGMATIRRPSAKVSPRIAPKPKPVAKIVAKTKRSSQDGLTEIIKVDPPGTGIEANSGSTAYSCSTLPRKFSRKNMEHIYDKPAEQPGAITDSGIHSTFGCNSTPNSPAHQGQYAASPWGKGSKKAPPPPPKRTNSMKSNMNKVGRGPEIRVEDTSDSHNGGRSWGNSSPQPPHSPQVQKQTFPNCVQSLTERFHSKQQEFNTNRRSQSPNNTDNFPPPPPQLPNHASSIASSSPSVITSSLSSSVTTSSNNSSYSNSQFTYMASDSDNPLNDIIQQLETASSSSPSPHTHGPAPPVAPKPSLKDKNGHKDVKLGDWQDGQVDSGEDSDMAEAKRKEIPQASSENTTSSGGPTDTNTLPFANENVGTIKQRNPANKPSIVTVSGSEDLEGDDNSSKNIELNACIFDEGTDTIKRQPKSRDQWTTEQKKEVKKVAPPVAPKRKDLANAAPTQSGNVQKDGSGDVLNDIDNMLQDLTNELDAMLEFEM